MLATKIKMMKDLTAGDLIVEAGETFKVLRVIPKGSTFVRVTLMKDGAPVSMNAWAIGSVEVAA